MSNQLSGRDDMAKNVDNITTTVPDELKAHCIRFAKEDGVTLCMWVRKILDGVTRERLAKKVGVS